MNNQKMDEETAKAAAEKIPRATETFKQIICDLTADLTKVYPEYSAAWSKWNPDMSEEELNHLFQYCLVFYPARFFDILNKNEDIFASVENKDGQKSNTEFLPGVEFKALYHCEGISQNTRDTIWKYLQLILFHTVQSMNDSLLFGEAIKMFEDIDTNDLKTKINDAMNDIDKMFSGFDKNGASDGASTEAAAAEDISGEDDSATESSSDDEDAPPKFRPFSKFDAEQMHNHLSGLLNGKIGTIAKELAEEISGELNDDILNMMDGECTGNMMNDTQAFLGKLKDNPGKMMDIVQKIVGKLKNKMAAGDITQDDLMKELSGIMDKLKNIPGMGGMDKILKQFMRGMNPGGAAGGGAGGKTRIDLNAFNQMSKQSQFKEKLRARMENKKKAQIEAAVLAAARARAAEEARITAAPIDDSWIDAPSSSAAAGNGKTPKKATTQQGKKKK